MAATAIEGPGLRESADVEVATIVDLELALLFAGRAGAVAAHVGDRRDGLDQHPIAGARFVGHPEVAVLVVVLDQLEALLLGLVELELVLRDENARGETAGLGRDVGLAQQIPEAGIFVAQELAREIDRAAASAHEPPAVALASPRTASVRHQIEHARREEVATLRSRISGAQVEHAAHAIAVAR